MNLRQVARLLLAKYSADRPLVLLDVGAAGGYHGRWQCVREHLRFIGVEPDPQAYAKLVNSRRPKDVILNVALAECAGKRALHITRNPECSSLYVPNVDLVSRYVDAERFTVDRIVSIDVMPLDQVLDLNGIAGIDAIKLDTQGSELAILNGGRRTLSTTFIIETEVEFQDLYVGQPLFSDVDAMLRGNDFELCDVARHFWRRKAAGLRGSYRGQLIWGDALYVKNAAAYLEGLANMGALNISSVAKAAAACLVYGYPDVAIELIQHRQAPIDSELKKALEKLINSALPTFNLPAFRGKVRMQGVFRRLYELFRASDYNSDDESLGN